jgi:hypothetical protein
MEKQWLTARGAEYRAAAGDVGGHTRPDDRLLMFHQKPENGQNTLALKVIPHLLRVQSRKTMTSVTSLKPPQFSDGREQHVKYPINVFASFLKGLTLPLPTVFSVNGSGSFNVLRFAICYLLKSKSMMKKSMIRLRTMDVADLFLLFALHVVLRATI